MLHCCDSNAYARVLIMEDENLQSVIRLQRAGRSQITASCRTPAPRN